MTAMNIQKIGIVSKPKKLELREIVPPLLEWLRARDIEVCIDKETGAIINNAGLCLMRNEMAGKVDLLIVLGGDGTLLATARALHGKPVPILAVNLGGLGFLTVITQEELYPTLECVLHGEYRSERRVQLEGTLIRADEVITSFLALNDVVLNKGAISRILDFELIVNGQIVSSYKSDGLIVSPICAHTLTHRPLVIPDNANIEIAVTTLREAAYLTVDGQVGIATHSEDRVCLKKADSYVELIQSADKDYFRILQQKLRWGER